MSEQIEIPYTFGRGFVQNNNTARVIAQFSELVADGSESSILMMWSKKNRRWHHFNLGWTAINVLASKSQMYALNRHGRVLVADASGVREEILDDGPNPKGDVCDMCLIGDNLYVAGMNRRVYRREGPNQWVNFDEGISLPADEDQAAGFKAIHGTSESGTIAVVGLDGEIWQCQNGDWLQVDSPTNINLSCVRVINSDLAYAGGDSGVLLVGKGRTWKSIEHNTTKEDIWDIEWFNNRLYITTKTAFWALGDNDKLELVNMGLGPGISFRHLHANDGVLWSFGPKDISWTEDGKKWRSATPTFSPIDPATPRPGSNLSESSCSCSSEGASHTGSSHKCS